MPTVGLVSSEMPVFTRVTEDDLTPSSADEVGAGRSSFHV